MIPYNLDENYRIASDKLCYILQHRTILTNRETGETYENWANDSYYQSIDGCCRGWAKAIVHENEMELPDALAVANALLEATLEEIRKAAGAAGLGK